MTKHTPLELRNQTAKDFLKSGVSEYQFAKNLPISRHSLRNWVVDYKKQEEIRKTNPHKINVPYTGRISKIDEESKKTKKLFFRLLDTNNLNEKEYKELSEKYKDYSSRSPIKTVLSCYDPNWKADNLIASWYKNNIMTILNNNK